MDEKKFGDFYDYFWSRTEVKEAWKWPTWSVVKEFISNGKKVLEVGPGVNPRVPFSNSWFVEENKEAVRRLLERGGRARMGRMEKLPFADNFFDCVFAFEVLEHIEDDLAALKEVYRVLKKGGVFVFSVPLKRKFWSVADEVAGHKRRYEREELRKRLFKAGFSIKKYWGATNVASFLVFRKTVGVFKKYFNNWLLEAALFYNRRLLPGLLLMDKYLPKNWRVDNSFEKIKERDGRLMVVCERRKE
jgi:SAM-dependent methyltransferase